MEVVDRHGWVEGMTIQAHGVHVGLRVDQRGYLPRFAEILPPEWRPSSHEEVRRLYSLRTGRRRVRGARPRNMVLYMNAFRLERSQDEAYLLQRLEMDLQLYVAERSPNRIFVHAGVVGWNGKALLLPGMTLSGKSTLVRALIDLGATYYSDEYALLDEKGRVHPYLRDLSVRKDPADPFPEKVSPLALGATLGADPLPVGLVAFLRYDPGVRFSPREVPKGKAVLGLLENTVPARRRPKTVLRVLHRVVARAQSIRGRRGEAEAVAESLLRRLG